HPALGRAVRPAPSHPRWSVKLRPGARLFARRPHARLVRPWRWAGVAPRHHDRRRALPARRPQRRGARDCLLAGRLRPGHRRRRPDDQALGAVCGGAVPNSVREASKEALGRFEMKRIHRFWIGPVSLALGGMRMVTAAGASDIPVARTPVQPKGPRGTAGDALALAEQINRLLAAKWSKANVRPARSADDAEYLRRVYLDLVGKIPTAAEACSFLDDPSPDKRARLVQSLLESPAYLSHATETYRSLLWPEADTDGQLRSLTPTFEAWLRKKIAEEAGYQEIVREVLTVRLGGRGSRAGNAYDPRAEPSPLAFYVAKDAKPENLAAGTARTFLGLRLECAQCHNHRFDHWKREEFWGLAAF